MKIDADYIFLAMIFMSLFVIFGIIIFLNEQAAGEISRVSEWEVASVYQKGDVCTVFDEDGWSLQVKCSALPEDLKSGDSCSFVRTEWYADYYGKADCHTTESSLGKRVV